MRKLIDLTGKRFGHLMVIERAIKNNKSAWLCKCDCGKEKIIQQCNLVSGKSKSCGCRGAIKKIKEPKIRYKDITNQRFGRLIALYPINVGKGTGIKWHCICDCGNEKDILSVSLFNGNTKSCGCYHRDITSNHNKKPLIGEKFGLLTVIDEIKERTYNRKVLYKCRCDCGNIKIIRGNSLLTGNTFSCGCLRMSHGEFKIYNLLKEHNIDFIQEYHPDADDIFNGARYDFYIPLKKLLIEYDGRQHVESNAGWDESLENIQRRDNLKNQWAIKHNYTLIRIPYTHYDDLCIDDLLPESSIYIIKNTEE